MFDQNIDILPNSLTHLTLDVSFTQIITILPKSLKEIQVHYKYLHINKLKTLQKRLKFKLITHKHFDDFN